MITQKERIAERLRVAGKQGVTTAQLFDGLFCCNYKARISDLRRDGYDIRGFKIKGSAQWRYFMFYDLKNQTEMNTGMDPQEQD